MFYKKHRVCSAHCAMFILTQLLSLEHLSIIKILAKSVCNWSLESGVQILFLYWGWGIIGKILTKFSTSRVWGMIFQLSKNSLKSKRKLSNFQFHVPQQC